MKLISDIGDFFTKYKQMRVIILCVFAATTFWFFNALNETYSTNISYPVTFEFDRSEYIVMRELPDEVDLNLEGIGWDLFRKSLGIKVTPLRIFLENPAETSAIPGSSIPALVSDQLGEFRLNYVLTDSLNVSIDRRVSKTFRVKVDSTNIDIADNHLITSRIRYNPDSIFLIGPAMILQNLGDTVVLNLPETEIDDDYNRDVPVTFSRDDVIQKSPNEITVIFDVERLMTTTFQIDVSKRNFPKNVDLIDSIASVEVQVIASDLQRLEPGEIIVIADYRNLNRADSVIQPSIQFFPDYIRNISMDSTSLKVKKKNKSE